MRIYGVPFTGSVFVEAESPSAAFEVVQGWSEAVLKASVASDTLPADGVGIIIIKPTQENIRDATDEIRKMEAEAEAQG